MGLLSLVNKAIYELILGPMNVFHGMGMNLFRAFAGIIVVWFGLQVALDGGGIHFSKFNSLVQRLAFGYAMIAYYNTPIPGFGFSFVHLFTDHAQWMVDALSISKIQELFDRLGFIGTGLEFPSWYEVGAIFMVVSIVTL